MKLKRYLIISCFLIFSISCVNQKSFGQCSGQYIVYLNAISQTSVSAYVYDSIGGTNTYYLEYGIAGFTPGTNANPGAGGTVLSLTVSGSINWGVNFLTPSTIYDFYLRKTCSGNWSVNSPKKTVYTFFDCSSPTAIICNNYFFSSAIPAGAGAWNLSCSAAGRESFYSFTPTVTGTHTLSLYATPTPVTWFYKPVSQGCSCYSWNCIGSSNTSTLAKFSFLLNAGTAYYLLAKANTVSGAGNNYMKLDCGCQSITNVTATDISPSSAHINYLPQWTSHLVEYGPYGFIPGTGATPGVNGKLGSDDLQGLTPSTTYDVYVRADCYNYGTYGANSPVCRFTTSYCPEIDYGTLGSTLALFPSYAGTQVFPPSLWNSFGFFPGTHGEERIAKFTSPSGGTYEMHVTNNSPTYTDSQIFFRKATDTCDLKNYTYPYFINYTSSNDYSFWATDLKAGSVYNILEWPYDSNITFESDLTINCANVKNISITNVQTTSAVVNFDCACPNPVYLEYGPAGFTPGTGTTGNGTLVVNVTSPYTITGLSPYTKYDVYLRSACGTIITDNVSKSFRTNFDCANAPVLTCGSTLTYVHSISDASGNWSSVCPTGYPNTSAEAVYQFTPTQTGMYRLTNYASTYWTGNPIAAYYKTSGSCDSSGWNCIGAVNQPPQAFTFGPLTANTSYLILFDAASNTGNTTKSIRLDCIQSCNASISPSADFTICQGMTATLQANTGAGITYQWYMNGGPVTNATSSSLTVSSTGWYSVIENTSCGLVTSNNVYVYVSTGVTASLTYNTPLSFCPPGYVQLTANTNFYTTTYQWQRNGANIAGATQQSYQVTDSGIYRVQASAAGCTSQFSYAYAITKATSVTGNYISAATSNVCPGGGLLLSVQNSQLYPNYQPIPGYSYQWQNNGTNIGGATSTTYNATAAGTYSCVVTANCGTTAPSRVVNSATLPSVSIAANGPTTFCNGSVNLTATLTGSGVTTTWKRNGITIFSGFIQVINATESGNYKCIVTNSCGSVTSNTITVTANKSPVLSAVTGNTGFCSPSSGNIYSVIQQAGVTFNWTKPTGASISNGQGTHSITVAFSSNATSGNICVTGSNAACGVGASSCLAIKLRSSVTTPGTITGSTNGCRQSKVYSIRKVGNAEYYLWTPPQGAAVNGSTSALQTMDTIVVVTFDSTFTGDTLRVQAVNCKGMSAQRKLRINNNPPAKPGPISGSVYGNCNKNTNYSISPVADAVSYTWRTNVPGATVYGLATPYTTTSTYVSVYFTNGLSGQVFVKANGLCGSSAEKSITVYARPATPTTIYGPATVCDSAQQVYYYCNSSTGATSYNWTVPAGATITSGQGTYSIYVNFGGTAATGNIKVRAQDGCANTSYISKSVTINSCPRLAAPSKSVMQLYPNPYSTTAILTLPDETDLTASNVYIYNLLGIKVRSILKPENYTIKIDRGELQPGVYIIKLMTNGVEKGVLKTIVE